MTSAGIYGFIDMSRDIKNGTMIHYEDLSTPIVKAYTRSKNQQQATANAISEKLAVIEANKKKLEDAEKLKIAETELKFSDFSRGEGIYLPPTETELTTEKTDAPFTSAKKDTVKTTPPPSTAQVIKPESKSVAVVEETQAPVLEARYFSRGSPKMYKKSLAKK